MEPPDADSLVDEQIEYYRARAPDYDDWWLGLGRFEMDDDLRRRWEAGKRSLREALRQFQPAGDVLELAAGTGNLTRHVATMADHVTAVDASGEALAIARSKLEDPTKVTFVEADLFDWRPPRTFDAVVFGFWLSHVPPGRTGTFWDLVGDALRPGGRVFFTDNAWPVTHIGRRAIAGVGSSAWLDHGVALRELADGRRFCIVKRAWTPEQLEAELGGLGWKASVHETDGLFLHGTAARQTTSDGN